MWLFEKRKCKCGCKGCTDNSKPFDYHKAVAAYRNGIIADSNSNHSTYRNPPNMVQ